MADKAANIKKVAKMMASLDFCMLLTNGDQGMRARPMSNNGEVEFDGDVWFFSAADSRKVDDIHWNSNVHLSYSDLERFLFISMVGDAQIVTDVAKKKELWMEELEQWFEEGPESESVVLIKVTPARVAWWGKDGDGEIELA